MKKIFTTVFIIVILSSSVYGVQVSFGVNLLGLGPIFQRGIIYNKNMENIKNSGATSIKSKGIVSSTDLVFQIDFVKFFATEIGVGYVIKDFGESFNNIGTHYENISSFAAISIPLSFRFQYEAGNFVNLYAGVGPRFNFNIEAYNYSAEDGITKRTSTIKKSEYNMFDMDINFSLGLEFKIFEYHYLGLRAAYNLNVLGLYKSNKYYVDDLLFHLTYRYAFVR